MISFLKKIKNILWCSLYSFRIISFANKQAVVKPGEILQLTGIIRNNGWRPGTVYCIIKLADPYNHSNIIYDTDRDFVDNQKQTLRIAEIPVSGERQFSCDINLPKHIKHGVLDICVEIWTPRKLFRRTSKRYDPYLFDKTNWRGSVEVFANTDKICKVFISYAWFSQSHINWVRQLSEELIKYRIETVLDQKDVFPGDEITLFMEEATISHPICIAVCSSSYTQKANQRKGGVGYEISILTKQIFSGKQKFTIIPILRDNDTKEIPVCFGSIMHVDMDTEEWRAQPLSQLILAILRKAEKNI